jgi:hypothetical protein
MFSILILNKKRNGYYKKSLSAVYVYHFIKYSSMYRYTTVHIIPYSAGTVYTRYTHNSKFYTGIIGKIVLLL